MHTTLMMSSHTAPPSHGGVSKHRHHDPDTSAVHHRDTSDNLCLDDCTYPLEECSAKISQCMKECIFTSCCCALTHTTHLHKAHDHAHAHRKHENKGDK